jgi:hypothetical protein
VRVGGVGRLRAGAETANFCVSFVRKNQVSLPRVCLGTTVHICVSLPCQEMLSNQSTQNNTSNLDIKTESGRPCCRGNEIYYLQEYWLVTSTW